MRVPCPVLIKPPVFNTGLHPDGLTSPPPKANFQIRGTVSSLFSPRVGSHLHTVPGHRLSPQPHHSPGPGCVLICDGGNQSACRLLGKGRGGAVCRTCREEAHCPTLQLLPAWAYLNLNSLISDTTTQCSLPPRPLKRSPRRPGHQARLQKIPGAARAQPAG